MSASNAPIDPDAVPVKTHSKRRSALDKALNIDDLRNLAKRRLPRVIFDYVEGGADDEMCLARNLAAFDSKHFIPRYLIDISSRRQDIELFGVRYASPFGISPTGMAAVTYPDADILLAQAAAAADIPYILSGGSNALIEDIARIAPKAWYQLYPAKDWAISADIISRTAAAGLKTLVVTVDVPIHPKRERNIRSGWVRPYKPTLPVVLEALRHPGWVVQYLRNGLPYMENWRRYAGPGVSALGLTSFYAQQIPSAQTIETLARIRAVWKGKLVVKGIMHPNDAVRVEAAGADGVIVSNHGGRQLDRSACAIDMLPFIREALKPGTTVMYDSGIRRGSDILTALALGADCAFVGRATLYGAAAAGRRGADRAIAILTEEIDLVQAQIGVPSLDRLDRSFLAGY
jgi:(S)-mandelate dehydrogenase